jgi:hypothetical protein
MSPMNIQHALGQTVSEPMQPYTHSQTAVGLLWRLQTATLQATMRQVRNQRTRVQFMDLAGISTLAHSHAHSDFHSETNGFLQQGHRCRSGASEITTKSVWRSESATRNCSRGAQAMGCFTMPWPSAWRKPVPHTCIRGAWSRRRLWTSPRLARGQLLSTRANKAQSQAQPSRFDGGKHTHREPRCWCTKPWKDRQLFVASPIVIGLHCARHSCTLR